MTESKIGLTHRLEQEGRWAEASLFKDNHIAQLRAEGKPRREAQQAAWEAMANEFPPREGALDRVDADIEGAELPDWPQDEGVHFNQDAMWVYRNLAKPTVQPADAPSAGAWSLLQWAKRHEDRFFENVMPKVLAARSKQEDDDLQEDPYVDRRENTLEALRNMAEQIEERYSENTSETIKQQVGSEVLKWCQRYEITLPTEAMESWERRMIHVADELVQVAVRNPKCFYHPHSFEEK